MVDNELLTESRVYGAYQVLFVDAGRVTGSLLRSVQLPEIKKAYRRRALDTHPDRFGGSDALHRKQCTERFIEVAEAYEILNSYLALRDRGVVLEWEVSGAWESASKVRSAFRSRPGPAAASCSNAQSPFSFNYWGRGMPDRPLRFGEYLYYSKVIPWRSLIGALVWQRRQRPRIGEIARRWRWLTESDIAWLLQRRRPGERFGEVLLRYRLISPFQLDLLLWQQQRFQKRIGEYFLQEGFLTEAQLCRHLQQQQQHNARFHFDLPRNRHRWQTCSK